jgi:hypothetical protein
MAEEMACMKRYSVFEIVDPPPNARIIKNRWVHHIKRSANGDIVRLRSRWVICGYSQQPGVDFGEIFAPVVHFDTIRGVLAIAAREGLFTKQLDIRVAFLNSPLKEELYSEQPKGFEDGTGRKIKLLKATYGLRQGPKEFNDKLRKAILALGLKASSSDPCLFYRPPPKRCLLAAYVDDCILAFTDESELNEFLEKSKRTFELTSEPLNFFLGVHITSSEDRKTIRIHQAKYVDELLQRFGLTQCKPVATPTDNTINTAFQSEIDTTLQYRVLVGSLMYLSMLTRGDISFAISKLSRYLDKPTKPLFAAGLRVLKYLKSTKAHGPVYTSEGPADLIVYCDADHAGELKGRRSTSGALFKFGGGPVGWTASLQKVTAISSTEAEIYSMSNAVKSCAWWTRILRELDYPTIPVIRMDSQPAIHIIRNEQHSPKAKHIDIREFFIREKLASGEVVLEYCTTELNLADIFTKSLAKPRFQMLRDLAGFHDASANRSNAVARSRQ